MFGFCITHILNTGVPKFEKKKSVAKRLTGVFRMLSDVVSNGKGRTEVEVVRKEGEGAEVDIWA